VWVIAEFAEDPGAEHYAEAGLAQVAFSVPVSAKMVGRHLPELFNLIVIDLHLDRVFPAQRLEFSAVGGASRRAWPS
jgi:hypothetical protein